MINEQLLQYIKKQREAGTSDADIKASLREAGWKDEDIAEGFEAVTDDKNSPQNHQQMREAAREDKQASTEPGSQQSATVSDSSQNQQQATEKQTKNTDTQTNKQQPAQESEQTGESQSGDTQTQEKNQAGGQNQNQQDAYREAVSEEDRQGAGAAGPSKSAANADPTPLRTMENDRQQVQGESQQKTQQVTDKSPQSETGDADSGSQADDNQAEGKPQSQSNQQGASVEKQLTKQQRAKKRQAKQQQNQRTDKQTENKNRSKQSKQASVSKMRPTNNKRSPKSRSAANSQASQKPSSSRIQEARRQSSSASSIATIILSILGLLLVGGAAAYAYVTYFQGPSSTTNAQAVLQSLADAESFQYRIGINNQTDNEDGVVIEGAVDVNANTEAQTYYTIESGDNQSGTPVTGLASEFSQYPDLDPRKQQAVQEALDNQQFLQVGEFQTVQKLGVTENSSGFRTHRFGVTINPSRLFSTYSTIHQEIYDESIDSSLATTLQDNLSSFTPEQGQLWVHPTSSVPYQLTVIGSNADDESVQVNVQLKNHGQEITALTDTYQTRSFASGLDEFFADENSAAESDIATTTQPNLDDEPDGPNNSTDQSTTTTSNATTSEPTDTQQQRRMMQRQDQMRINDIQQIVVALRVYVRNNGELPSRLAELAGGEVLSSVPEDPQTGQAYRYVRTPSGRYHVGATLRATSDSQLTGDDNYNSTGSASNGFAGSASVCGPADDRTGSTCYDKTGQSGN